MWSLSDKYSTQPLFVAYRAYYGVGKRKFDTECIIKARQTHLFKNIDRGMLERDSCMLKNSL